MTPEIAIEIMLERLGYDGLIYIDALGCVSLLTEKGMLDIGHAKELCVLDQPALQRAINEKTGEAHASRQQTEETTRANNEKFAAHLAHSESLPIEKQTRF